MRGTGSASSSLPPVPKTPRGVSCCLGSGKLVTTRSPVRRPIKVRPAVGDPTGSCSPGGAGKVAQALARDGATVVSSWPAAGLVTLDVARLPRILRLWQLRWEGGGYGHLCLPLAWSAAPQWPGGGGRDEPGEPCREQSELLGAKGASGEQLQHLPHHLLLCHLWQQANFLAPQQAVIWSGKYVEQLKNNCQICARYIPQPASGLKYQSWKNMTKKNEDLEFTSNTRVNSQP